MSEPSVGQQLWSIATAVGSFVADGFTTVTPEQYEERLKICDACEHRRQNKCGLCKCNLKIKAGARAWTCPDNPPRWPVLTGDQPMQEPTTEVKTSEPARKPPTTEQFRQNLAQIRSVNAERHRMQRERHGRGEVVRYGGQEFLQVEFPPKVTAALDMIIAADTLLGNDNPEKWLDFLKLVVVSAKEAKAITSRPIRIPLKKKADADAAAPAQDATPKEEKPSV